MIITTEGNTHHFWEPHEEVLVRLVKEKKKQTFNVFSKGGEAQLQLRKNVPCLIPFPYRVDGSLSSTCVTNLFFLS